MSTPEEKHREQTERLKPVLGGRICAGVIVIEKEDAVFEVWAYRQLTEEELLAQWATYNAQRDRRKSIRGQRIVVAANHGAPLQ